MSLSSYVQDLNSPIYRFVNKDSLNEIKTLLKQNARPTENIRPCNYPPVYRAIVGTALKWATMAHLGKKAINDHPIAKSCEQDFWKLFYQWNTPEEFSLHLAILDAKVRGTSTEGIANKIKYSTRTNMYYFEESEMITQILSDIKSLIITMKKHFAIETHLCKCVYCDVVNNISNKKIMVCQQCGAPLIVLNNETIINKNTISAFNEFSLTPDLAREVGGADIAMSLNDIILTTRTVQKFEIHESHIMMPLGWMALYEPNRRPPYRWSTIYFTRQACELTFSIFDVAHNIEFDMDGFRNYLKQNFQLNNKVYQILHGYYPNDN